LSLWLLLQIELLYIYVSVCSQFLLIRLLQSVHNLYRLLITH